MPRTMLETLNFDALDSSDSMRHFVHRMRFKKTPGFAPVEKVRATELDGPADEVD